MKIVDTFCLHFVPACVVDKNLNTPNWNSITDDTITQEGIGVLGSLFYVRGHYIRFESH